MNLVYWTQPQVEQATNIAKIRVTKAPERTGTYATVQTISPAQTAGVWTLQYLDSSGLPNEWYIAEYLDSSDNIIAKGDAIRGRRLRVCS